MFLEKINVLKLKTIVTRVELKKLSVFVLLFTLGQIAVSWLFNLNTFVISRGDSSFYFTASNRVSNLTSFEELYRGYIYLLHVSRFFSDSGIFMVLIQSLFVILAGYALFSIAKEISDLRAAWIAVVFYFFLPMLTQWTRYILTESIFYALIVIGIRLATLRKNGWNEFLLVPVIVLMIFLRPNGFISACAILTILLLSKSIGISKSIGSQISVSLVIFIWCAGAFFGLTLLSSNDVGQQTVQSTIFDKTLEGNVVFGAEETRYKMPQPLSADRSNMAFIKYISEYPGDNLRLGALRLVWEFKQVRPWYSPSLNLFISFIMSGFYLFAFIGLIRVKNKVIIRAAVFFTIPSALLIAGTWAIWEGRFAWWALVCWIPFFAAGISVTLEYMSRAVRRLHS